MRRTFRTRRRRTKRHFMWAGTQTGSSPSATQTLDIPPMTGFPSHIVLVIIGPEQIGMGESNNYDLLLHRVLFGFTVQNPAGVPGLLNMELEVVDNTLDDIPLTTPPDFDDQDAFQRKSPMWCGSYFLAEDTSVGTSSAAGFAAASSDHAHLGINQGLPIDIRVKRKITADQSLVMKFGSLNAVGELTADLEIVHFWARCLVSAGRK